MKRPNISKIYSVVAFGLPEQRLKLPTEHDPSILRTLKRSPLKKLCG
jgi:hypothetical protein